MQKKQSLKNSKVNEFRVEAEEQKNWMDGEINKLTKKSYSGHSKNLQHHRNSSHWQSNDLKMGKRTALKQNLYSYESILQLYTVM